MNAWPRDCDSRPRCFDAAPRHVYAAQRELHDAPCQFNRASSSVNGVPGQKTGGNADATPIPVATTACPVRGTRGVVPEYSATSFQRRARSKKTWPRDLNRGDIRRTSVPVNCTPIRARATNGPAKNNVAPRELHGR